MKNRWLVGLVLLMVLVVGYSMPQQVSASSGLVVEAEIGINNQVKMEMPTFVNVTITNNGEPFSGDFVVDAEARYNVGSALVFPLDIATGETKTMTVYIDGLSDSFMYVTPTPDLFYFYEGGIEKGKKVKYEGDHSVKPRFFNLAMQIGFVVTTRQDEIASIDRMGTYVTDDVELFYIDRKDSPYLAEDARMLSMVDFIVFDDIALHDLNDKQQKALFEWVQQGGKLAFIPNLVGANAAGIFAEHLPLTLAPSKTVLSAEQLKKYVATNAQIEPAQVYASTLNEGAKAALAIDGTTIAGAKNVGKGQVLQLTFTLNDPIISKLTGYGRLMVDIFELNNARNDISLKYGFAPDWVSNNELFETFRMNTWLLLGGIVLYIIIIGPVLYFVLKRKDQREKMWLYVPVIAVVTSLLFFVFGARDRLFSPQIGQMALYEVQEDGTLIGTFTNAILSNKTGDFTFLVEEGTSASASQSSSLNVGGALHMNSYIKETADGSELVLRDMDYWSIGSVVGETVIANAGQLTSDLTLENNRLTGTVTNGLAVDLNDVKILTGRDEIVLGTMKAGETLTVDQEVQKQYLAKPFHYDPYLMSQQPSTDFFEAKMDQLKSAAISANTSHKGPVLVGWSDVSLAPIQFDGNAKQETISYFAQAIQPNIVLAEEVTFTEEDTVPYMESVDGNSWGHLEEAFNNRQAYLSEGQHKFYFDFETSEEIQSLHWKALEIVYDDAILKVELYNHATGEYVPLENGKQSFTENIAQFVEADSYLQLQLKIERVGMDDGQSVTVPTFTLKGEPKQ